MLRHCKRFRPPCQADGALIRSRPHGRHPGGPRLRHPEGLRRDGGGGRRLVHGRGGRDLRPDRPERGRQDHDHGVRRGPAAARPGAHRGARARPRPRRRRPSAPHRRSVAGGAAPEAHQGVGGGGPVGRPLRHVARRRPAARPARADGPARRVVHDPVGGPEAAAVHRPRPDQRARAGVPRRADDRPRSPGAAGHLGPGARHPRPRADGVPDHPPDGGGGDGCATASPSSSTGASSTTTRRPASSPGTARSARWW